MPGFDHFLKTYKRLVKLSLIEWNIYRNIEMDRNRSLHRDNQALKIYIKRSNTPQESNPRRSVNFQYTSINYHMCIEFSRGSHHCDRRSRIVNRHHNIKGDTCIHRNIASNRRLVHRLEV